LKSFIEKVLQQTLMATGFPDSTSTHLTTEAQAPLPDYLQKKEKLSEILLHRSIRSLHISNTNI